MGILHRAFGICALLIASLQAQPSLPAGSWRISEAPAGLRSSIARADIVVATLQNALLRELRNALDQGGPAFAIQSCHIDTIGVIQRTARSEGIEAGRTSDRLRNAANAPRPWAAPLVEMFAGRQASDVEGFAVDLGDRVGVLKPIAEQSMCASCHGPAAKISPEVRTALASRYVTDRATGFTVGEIRGWFWVEVPKQTR